MQDYIIRAISKSKNIRAFVALTTSLVEKARVIHNASPVAIAALGRTLTAGSIMGIMLKGEDDNLTIRIKGDGELGGLLVASDSRGNVRGYLHNPQVDLPLKSNGKLDVSGAIGSGYLNVIKDIGLKDPYIGQVPLVSGEIAEDVAEYFLKSEQVNSAIGLGVLVERDYSVDVAGGFFIQALPGIDDNELFILEERIKEIPSVTNLFKEYRTPEEVMNYIMDIFEMTIIDTIPVQYLCTCSRERIERALISMGKKELESLIVDQGEAQIECHFCDTKYQFNKEELERLIIEGLN